MTGLGLADGSSNATTSVVFNISSRLSKYNFFSVSLVVHLQIS